MVVGGACWSRYRDSLSSPEFPESTVCIILTAVLADRVFLWSRQP